MLNLGALCSFLCDLLFFNMVYIFTCNCYFCLRFNPNKWYQSEVVFLVILYRKVSRLSGSLTVKWKQWQMRVSSGLIALMGRTSSYGI